MAEAEPLNEIAITPEKAFARIIEPPQLPTQCQRHHCGSIENDAIRCHTNTPIPFNAGQAKGNR
ncbi:hypothetical protein LMG27198_27510 [Methylocystis echinoides]|uniref:Uncharacterized protein n=1 Tax=Methylocystis echinoides TaxID=29468 RepID=A0A9W6LSW9_9HYPH|nr:hypothetical protein LMG27198_27510 [Methylocystis echinoides]